MVSGYDKNEVVITVGYPQSNHENREMIMKSFKDVIQEPQISEWPSGVGQLLKFEVYDIDNTDWSKDGGIYIFCHEEYYGWNALYIGQTEDFSSRLPDHDRLKEAVKKGATHIHTMVVNDDSKRKRLEVILIEKYLPDLNFQHTNG